MKETKRTHAKVKSILHPRNEHRERYDFPTLIEETPELQNFVKPNKYGDDSIDFSDAAAVKCLNTALLKKHYRIDFWDIPEGYLVPPIPGRADYIHYAADLITSSNFGRMPENIIALDLGVGASCIYPIIGVQEYGWNFIASDTDSKSIEASQKITDENTVLKNKIDLRLQSKPKNKLKGILKGGERIDVIVCNPPFHGSLEEANAGSLRKLSNLNKKRVEKVNLNFGGQNAELWCNGGEIKFITHLIDEGKDFGKSVFWFTTLIAKRNHEEILVRFMKKAGATEVKIILVGQGNKTGRIVAWTFLDKEEQSAWRKERWTEKQ
jgi:23S rRNA (adenine1618-N6)-methyltransferase